MSEFTEIPKGFTKMGTVLTFENKLVKKIENKILYFLVRDYHILYSKVPKFDGKQWTEFHFYCRPKDESSLTYRLGCYAQAILGFYDKKHFENPIHVVPAGFPQSIHIKASYDDKHNLCIGDKAFEMGEVAHEIVK